MGAGAAARGFDVLLIDGRSGSGKTSLADSVLADLEAAGDRPQVLRVEDLYPGWDGLAEGSLAVANALDEGRTAGTTGSRESSRSCGRSTRVLRS